MFKIEYLVKVPFLTNAIHLASGATWGIGDCSDRAKDMSQGGFIVEHNRPQNIRQPLWAASALLEEGPGQGARTPLLVAHPGLFWDPELREVLAVPGIRSKNMGCGAGRTGFEFCLCHV